MNQVDHEEMRARMRSLGVTQFEVAKLLGLKGNTTVNQWLNGLKEMPPEFGQRVAEAVGILERANAAADDARNRVIQEADI